MTSLFRLTTIILLPAMLWLIPTAAFAASSNRVPHPPEGSSFQTAGKRVLARSSAGQLYSFEPRNLALDSWAEVQVENGAHKAVFELVCAQDGSGDCFVLLSSKDNNQIGFLQRNSNIIRPLDISATKLMLSPRSRLIYFTKVASNGSTELFRFDLDQQHSESLGHLSANDRLGLINLDQKQRVVIIDKSNGMRLVGSPNIVGKFPVRRQSEMFSRNGSSGLLRANQWFLNSGSQKNTDWLSATISLIFTRYKTNSDGSLEPVHSGLGVKTKSASLLHPRYLSTDSNGKILSTTVSEEGTRLAFVCQYPAAGRKPRHSYLSFESLDALVHPQIDGGLSGAGFLVTLQRPDLGETLSYIDFDGVGSHELGAMPCKKPKVFRRAIPTAKSSLPSGWSGEIVRFEAKDGFELDAFLVRQDHKPIRTLIIDSYGAFGSLRSYPDLPQEFFSELSDHGIAILYAAVRGDGNYGYGNAARSGSPNRQLAVQDLATIAREAKKLYLPKDGNLILRGTSAGAWLSARTSLTYPDLADEVIGLAGAYEFSEDKIETRSYGYFKEGDTITFPKTTNCKNTFFRVIHRTKDDVTRIDQMYRFVEKLKSASCTGAIHLFEGSDHGLPDFGQMTEKQDAKEILYLYHGLNIENR